MTRDEVNRIDLLEKDVSYIKRDVASIKQTQEDIRKDTKELREYWTKIDTGRKIFLWLFSSLATVGGLALYYLNWIGK